MNVYVDKVLSRAAGERKFAAPPSLWNRVSFTVQCYRMLLLEAKDKNHTLFT